MRNTNNPGTTTDLGELLSDQLLDVVSPYIGGALLEPANELFGRGGKRFRASLVEIGFSCGNKHPIEKELLTLGQSIMERLHTGSLIVDDIEDNSLMRRGEPCLHHQVGVPIALNAGNWNYFWPMHEVSLRSLLPALELELYRRYHRTLLLAHIGQALDVGVTIDTVPVEKMGDLTLASMELKSGALTSLAAVLGAVLSGADAIVIEKLEVFGTSFGMALQMFDDIGNFTGAKDPSKRFEDLKLRRPSWIWATIAQHFPDRLSGFREVVHFLPDVMQLEAWVLANPEVVREGKDHAVAFLEMALWELKKSVVPDSAISELTKLTQELIIAYE